MTGQTTMVRPPRPPIDLKATTEIKARCARVLVGLELIEQYRGPISQDPRSVCLGLTLSIHELEAALWIMKKSVLTVTNQLAVTYRRASRKLRDPQIED